VRGEGNKRRTAAAFAGACLATLVAVATATATIGVYVNNFANREAAKQILSAGGTHCERQWNKKTQTFGVTVKRGPALCGYRPPVTSDGDQPDQILEAQARVTRHTPKSVRHDAYVGLSVRNSASAGYELRVFPKGKRFSVKRNPDNGAFPVNGTAGGIRGINERNTLRLRAIGKHVKAFVNGHRIADVTDPSPGDVGGRKLEMLAGSTAHSKRDVIAVFDELHLGCPDSGC
jgi:hypothetical protein